MMRSFMLGVLLVFPAILTAQGNPIAREIPYQASTPLKLPIDVYFGENAGVAVNSLGHVFVYTRAGSEGQIVAPKAAALYEFDPDGNFLREIGRGLFGMAWAHAVRVDRDDNIWIVDNGSSMGVKLSPEGRVLQVFGRRAESTAAIHNPCGAPAICPPHSRRLPSQPIPPARDGYFNEPTDVAFDPQGNVYFSDGYNNSRVAKYDRDGNWVKSWGERGSGRGQFNLPHGIAADDQGRVYVVDRSNNRLQVFDGEGTFIREITLAHLLEQAPVPDGYRPLIPHFGVLPDGSYNSLWPNSICITPGPNQVIFTQDMFPGRIYKMSLEGEVLGYLARDGQGMGQLGWVHGLACPSENEVWVAELLTWRVQKLTLH